MKVDVLEEIMNPAPVKPGKLLADFHTHPSNRKSLEDTLKLLSSPGLCGLAHKTDTNRILTYEQAIEIVSPSSVFREITPGQMAGMGGGYFLRAQEVLAAGHHLLTFGWEGDYFPNYNDAFQAVQDIHDRNGIVILTHPYVLFKGLSIAFPNAEEEKRIHELCTIVEEIEVHNAYCIDLLPFGPSLCVKKANRLAQELIAEFPQHKGMAGSDCHGDPAQVKICGNYVNSAATQGIEELKQAVKTGSFERYGNFENGPYVSRWSWLKGIRFGLDWLPDRSH